jgi:hypothetical protein
LFRGDAGTVFFDRGTVRMAVKPFIISALLCVLASGFPGRSSEAQLPSANPADATASYRLIGTIESAPMSGAVLEDASGMQTFYRVHELLPDGSQCIKVRNDHVLLKRPDGTVYEVYISQNARAGVPVFSPSSAGPLVQENPVPKPANGQERTMRRGRSRKLTEED